MNTDWIEWFMKNFFRHFWWVSEDTENAVRKYLQENLPQEKTTVPNVLLYETGYKEWLLEAISYIWQDQWREESEDMYRKHFWLPTLYDKK